MLCTVVMIKGPKGLLKALYMHFSKIKLLKLIHTWSRDPYLPIKLELSKEVVVMNGPADWRIRYYSLNYIDFDIVLTRSQRFLSADPPAWLPALSLSRPLPFPLLPLLSHHHPWLAQCTSPALSLSAHHRRFASSSAMERSVRLGGVYKCSMSMPGYVSHYQKTASLNWWWICAQLQWSYLFNDGKFSVCH